MNWPQVFRPASIRPVAPVTFLLVLLAALGTLLLSARPELWSPFTTWAIHTDWHHLLCDLIAVASIGLWLEPRAGSARFAAYVALALAVSTAAHAQFYPNLSHLFGLSAVAWCIAAAAVARYARGRSRLLALLMLAVLSYECAGDGTGILTSLGKHSASESPFIPGLTVHPVPWVHASCALLGAALGLAARTPDSRPARHSSAQPCQDARQAPTSRIA